MITIPSAIVISHDRFLIVQDLGIAEEKIVLEGRNLNSTRDVRELMRGLERDLPKFSRPKQVVINIALLALARIV